MSSAATGSLGALLMIAPLAAIPVFAIVGVPSIGSMAAAPADELDVSDVEAIEDRPRPMEEGRRRAAATDLFESYDGQNDSRPRSRGASLSDGSRPTLTRGRGVQPSSAAIRELFARMTFFARPFPPTP